MKDLQPDIFRQRLIIEANLDHNPGPTEIYEFLKDLSVELDMILIRDPIIEHHLDWGWCGWGNWVTSGVMFYTYEKQKFITIDIYTCKSFTPFKCIDFVTTFFSPLSIEHKEV